MRGPAKVDEVSDPPGAEIRDPHMPDLARRMKACRVVDPANQPDKARVFFGARVELADEEDERKFIQLVGDDEQDASAGKVGWSSPIARALKGASIGDLRTVRLPGGLKEWEVMAIDYD